MKKLSNNLFVLFIVLFSFSIVSCNGLEEEFSMDTNVKLSFSRDTVSFDTVFTTIGSATKDFRVYNRYKKTIKVNNIRLGSEGKSGFYVNVNGRKGVSFDDVFVYQGDSMYIFVEVNINPVKENAPLHVKDSLLFTLANGVSQKILLEAYGQNVRLLKGGFVITSDSLLDAQLPYLIYDSVVVNENVQLSMAAGATFYMHDRAKWIVHGTLLAEGTRENPIVFRGDRLDDVIDNKLSYDCTPGQWGGLHFTSTSKGSKLECVVVKNGTEGIRLDESEDKNSLSMDICNSLITNMAHNLFVSYNNKIRAVNSEFSNAGRGVVVLIGGKAEFIHCTLANYMKLVGRNLFLDMESEMFTSCLTLANYRKTGKDEVSQPFESVQFDNCIIDGTFSASQPNTGELSLLKKTSVPFDFRFGHCVVKYNAESNDSFPFSIMGISPEYRMTGVEEEGYVYDFRLKNDTTPGVGMANIETAKLYPLDRMGVSRLDSKKGPSIGAYEFVEIKNDESKK